MLQYSSTEKACWQNLQLWQMAHYLTWRDRDHVGVIYLILAAGRRLTDIQDGHM